jgi:hypothetical protein
MSPRFSFLDGALLGEISTFTASLQLLRRHCHNSGEFFLFSVLSCLFVALHW